MMVELLAGALVGDNFSYETAAKTTMMEDHQGGEFILAISPDKLSGMIGINIQMNFLIK